MLSTDSLSALLDTLSEPIVAIDGRGVLIHVNCAGAQALGVKASEILGTPFDAYPALLALFAGVGQPGAAASGSMITTPDGSRWLTLPPSAPPTPTLASDRVKQGIHALKTPLSVAKSSLDLLDEADNLTAGQRSLIARTQENIAHMRATIDNLLYASSLECSDGVERAPTELGGLVRRLVADLEAGARPQGVTLRLALDGPCVVDGDAGQLEEAISNLLSNAIKYSPAGGEVQVVVERRGDVAAVRVEDQGLGIAPEHLPHVFEQFYRAATPETRRIKGSGLGLSIVKTIVERHGGEIHVESEPHAGSTFTVTLPLRASS